MATTHLPQTAAPPLMLERETELATLEALLAAARDGEGRLVVVEGSAGIGKTRLLAETRKLAERARVRGVRLRAPASWRASSRSGSSGSCSRLRSPRATPDVRAELLSGAAGLSASLFMSAPTTASGDGAESSFAMLHGLYWLAANVASRRPALLVVDDLHWADEPSLRWLAYLAHRLDGLPILLLVGTRPAEQANTAGPRHGAAGRPGAIAIRPGGLGEASAATLARERLAAEPDPVFAAALQTGSVATRSS